MSGIMSELAPVVYKSGIGQFCSNIIQCLEFGSVGSAVFWLPGSGTAKNMQILGSKGQFINQKVKNFYFALSICNCYKSDIIKNFLI